MHKLKYGIAVLIVCLIAGAKSYLSFFEVSPPSPQAPISNHQPKPSTNSLIKALKAPASSSAASPTPTLSLSPSPPLSSVTSEPVSEPLSVAVATSHSEFWLWLGFGENFQYYEQSIPSLEVSSKFQNIRGSTWSATAGFQGESAGMEISHKQAAGRIEGPPGSTTIHGDYFWTVLTIEGLYRPEGSDWRFRAGLQCHQMPLANYDATNTTLEIKSKSLFTASAGFDRSWNLSKSLRAEWLMRYQHPVSSEASALFAFDGSIGAAYKVNKNLRLGLYWFGQYHNHKSNSSKENSVFDDQTLVSSNAELRMGWEF